MTGFGTSPIELMATNAMLTGEIYCEQFYYSANWEGALGLGASATQAVQVQIDSSSDFIVQMMNLTALTDANTYDQDPDLLLQMVVAGSGRQIMQSPQHVANVTGYYRGIADIMGFPAALPFPRLIQANSTLTCTLQNRSTVDFSGGLIQLTLVGFKIFYAADKNASRRSIFHVL